MKVNNFTFKENIIVKLKGEDWLHKQRVAGKVVAKCLSTLKSLVDERTALNLLELSKLAEDIILQNKCQPTFKGYKGFPEAVCISVNNQLVHGIPTEYKLQEGDVVSFDLGATFEGAIADSAITCIYGEAKDKEHIKLIKATQDCLAKSIDAIKIGSNIGVIGNAIFKTAREYGFNVITQYGGHGIDMTEDGVGIPHASPFISNKANPTDGIRIQPGLAIAIEPILIMGDDKTYVEKDGWTVSGSDMSSHFEHSIYVHHDHVEIITLI